MASIPFTVTNPQGLPVRGDLHLPVGQGARPLIVACHGFKSFKDWGWYPAMGDWLAERGVGLLRFNFSLNGVEEDFQNFTHLENFARNTVTQELTDLQSVLDALRGGGLPDSGAVDGSQLYLLGHSRGAAIAIVHAARDAGIRGVISLAGIAEFTRTWVQPLLDDWKARGRTHVANSRTGQDMPLDYTLVEDILAHGDDYDAAKQAARLRCPLLILHGEEDTSVPISEGEAVARAADAELVRIPGAQHTFNIKHPFAGFTPEFDIVLTKILEFISARS